MDEDNKYTVSINMLPSLGNLKQGITIVYHANGMCCEYVGDYCEWPKREPTIFVVTDIKRHEIFIDEKIYIADDPPEPIKFYQKLNRKKW